MSKKVKNIDPVTIPAIIGQFADNDDIMEHQTAWGLEGGFALIGAAAEDFFSKPCVEHRTAQYEAYKLGGSR